jgi:hypothetical protein
MLTPTIMDSVVPDISRSLRYFGVLSFALYATHVEACFVVPLHSDTMITPYT